MAKNRTTPAARAASQPASAAARAGSPALRWLVPALIIALFLPGIFLLPYHVAMMGPNGSQSWEFGFNNTTAQEFIALMLLSLFAWRLYSVRSDYRQTPVGRVILGEGGVEGMRSLWLTMAILQLINFTILIIWYNILPYTHYGEFTYFMQRLEVMVSGRVPHRDFDFDYGSGMLAGPIFVYRLFRGRLSIEAAYFSVLLVHFAIGYTLLAYLLTRVNIQRGRAFLFLLLAVPFMNLTLGLQYTPLRFTIALASLFAIRHAHLAMAGAPRLRWVVLGLAALCLPFCNFLISPEMGLALTVALLAYFGWFILGPERRYAVLILPVIAGVALAVLVFPRAYFNSMLSFGKGGASFPIFPTMHILAFLAAAIWVFPQLGVIAIREKSAAAPFCAGLAILMGLFILPATGRCDAGHIFINSIGLLIITLSAGTWLARKWTYTMLGGFMVVFVVMIIAAFWDNYKEPMGDAMNAESQLSRITYQRDNYPAPSPGAVPPAIHYSKLLPMATWLAELPERPIGIPLGVDEATERYLHLTGRYLPEYHIAPYFDLFDPSTLPEKYEALRGMEYILIPEAYVGYLQPVNEQVRMRMQGEADCKFLSGLLLFPVDLDAVHPMFVPNIDIMHRIAQEYVLAKQYPHMLLLKRKPE